MELYLESTSFIVISRGFEGLKYFKFVERIWYCSISWWFPFSWFVLCIPICGNRAQLPPP